MKLFFKSYCVLLIALLNFSCTSPQVSDFDYQGTVDFAVSKLLASINEIPKNQYPKRTAGVGMWQLVEPSYWTSGFYPGSLWYGYKLKPSVNLLDGAIKFTEGLAGQQFDTSTHDLGFMMLNSFGHGYDLTDKREYKNIILQSAESLASRYHPKVGCTQSWGGDFQVIIDNLMNLELLFWAAQNGGERRFYDIAVSHASKTIRDHVREDGSSFHVVVYDTTTGKVVQKRTYQGYADSSCWARGQAWGIYGFTMTYRETRDSTFLKAAMKMTDYFINSLPDDFMPLWDFNLPDSSSKKYKDTSAAAIACSGLLELRNYVEDPIIYDSTIKGILKSLVDSYLSKNTESSGILLHGAYNVNNPDPFDWDTSTIWGDYYFLESLIRYKEIFK